MTSSTSSPETTGDSTNTAEIDSASRFNHLFPRGVSILAMLHLKGVSARERLERARREIDLLWDRGVDAIVVENYFGDINDVTDALDYLVQKRPEVIFGVNILNDNWLAFEVANHYGARFIQLDSVAGHLHPADDLEFGEKLLARRSATTALVFGGVRFKYQPIFSGRSVQEDLHIGMTRCDAIVVTGGGTGLTTPLAKIAGFRRFLGPDFPLIVGAGVTAKNALKQLQNANGVIVGSALKDTSTDTGDVHGDRVATFVQAVRNASWT